MWGGMKIWKCDTVDYCTTGIFQTRSEAQDALQTLRVITSVLSYFLRSTLHILQLKLRYILSEKQLQHIDIGILSRERLSGDDLAEIHQTKRNLSSAKEERLQVNPGP